MEGAWVDKIIALTAPVRITPTEDYYRSYYYLVDSISSKTSYTQKTIGEKLTSLDTDPYTPFIDEEIPKKWPEPDLNEKGELKDIVKTTVQAVGSVKGVKGVSATDYETTAVYLYLLPEKPAPNHSSKQFLEYATLLSTFDSNTAAIAGALLNPTSTDFDKTQQLSFNRKDLATTLPGKTGISMPESSPKLGDPILLPRGFKEHGISFGDRGYLSYYSPTPSSIQEQQIPVFVAGFYDPGIIPIGGKLILANRDLVSLIRSSSGQEETKFGNGINVRFDNLTDASKVKDSIVEALRDAGIAHYWSVSTYQEYEFTKDIIQQLQSEKNLFSLISLVIIIVACSNIISMLIILVNDKKLEIGILRSMGATSQHIATIFGVCGMVMGTAGSLLGILGALLTLHYVNELVGLISRIQGHDLFNPVFYGDTLPTALSMEALTLVIIATAAISLLAGIVPAIKASLMRPSAILRAE